MAVVENKSVKILSKCLLTFILLGCLTFTISSCAQNTDFKFSIGSGDAPLLIAFTNSSSDADEYLWDFGDGTTSTSASREEPVTHEYTKAGTYSVLLTSVNQENQTSKTTTKADIIEVKHCFLVL